MNAVGIDVSKGKSMVAAQRPMGEVPLLPREFPHTPEGLSQMAQCIRSLGNPENTRIVMEATGRYHEPVALFLHQQGFYVCVLNPLLIRQSGGGSLRKVKTDKADAMKISKYALDNWVDLREYSLMDTLRQQLKLLSRQYDLYQKTKTALENNLISLCEKVFPGVDDLFSSPERDDGHKKWVDFITTFWHCECISSVNEKSFSERYQKWCKRKGYHFSSQKAAEIYAAAQAVFPTLQKSELTKTLMTTAAKELTAASEIASEVRKSMIQLAKQLPEFETVVAMYGVGEITGSQLIAEIGDVRRFPNRTSLVAFAGVDPGVDQSGTHEAKSVSSTKRGSPHLRKTLFQIISSHVQRSPANEPVYQFLDRKRKEGKPYYVYMTAAANKFLRIYYARVKQCMAEAETAAAKPDLTAQ